MRSFHRAKVKGLEDAPAQAGVFVPNTLADEVARSAAKQLLGLRVGVVEAPLAIQ